MTHRLLRWLAAAGLSLWLTGPALALDHLPYDGALYLNDGPVDGQVELRFSLYDAAADGALLWQEAWTSDTRRVTARAGRFHVKLGSFVDLAPALARGQVAWLGIEVRPGGGAEWHALRGRQRLKLFPYAARTLGGGDPDYAVQDTLTAASLSAVGQPASAAGVTVTGTLNTVPRLFDPAEAHSQVAGAVVTRTLTTDQGHVGAPGYEVEGVAAFTGSVTSSAALDVADGRVTAATLTLGQPAAAGLQVGSLGLRGGLLQHSGLAGVNGTLLANLGNVLRFGGTLLRCGGANCSLTSTRALTGQGDLTIDGTVTSGTTQLNGGMGLSVTGQATVTHFGAGCRFCVQFVGRGGDRYACVALDRNGSESGWFSPSAQFTSQTFMQIGVDCSASNSAAGAGRAL